MIRLVVLDNSHKFKDGLFELESDKGERMDTLYWSNFLSSSFLSKYDDFGLVYSTHKINMYALSLVVKTIVDYLGISIPVENLVVSLEYSQSITNFYYCVYQNNWLTIPRVVL